MDDGNACTNRSVEDFNFLKLCVENLENISKSNFDWFIPDESIFEQEKQQ